jgi:lysozyme family protein
MKSSYPTAIKAVLAHEGGYTNHPADPGGPTNWGITIADARMYWLPNATAADVRAMPLSVAQEIYKKRYWDAQKCDLLPAGLDYSVFDYGVNSGIGRSGKVLRRILGLSDATSVVTQEVLDAVAKRDTKSLIIAMNDERLRFLKALRTWPTFGGGWGRRVAEVRAMSIQLASGKVAAAATPTPGTETMAKGDVPPPKPPTSNATKAAGAATAGTTVVVGGAAAAVQQGISVWVVLGSMLGASLALGAIILIIYRITKGNWPWTSTGKASPELLPLSHQSSAPSLEQASAALLAVSSAASPVTPLPRRSARKKPRKQSARQSRKTPTRSRKSSSSKRTAAKKSAPKRKPKSKS